MRVTPGRLATDAMPIVLRVPRARLPESAFNRDDLPTLERPAKAISASGEAAAAEAFARKQSPFWRAHLRWHSSWLVIIVFRRRLRCGRATPSSSISCSVVVIERRSPEPPLDLPGEINVRYCAQKWEIFTRTDKRPEASGSSSAEVQSRRAAKRRRHVASILPGTFERVQQPHANRPVSRYTLSQKRTL